MENVEIIYQYFPILFYSMIFFISLLVGSFLNVVIYRLPEMMEREWRTDCREFIKSELKDPEIKESDEKFNLMVPRSRCPKCGHAISALENVPVISWLVLKGKCKSCKNPIPVRYPSIELLTAILSVVVAYKFGPTLAGFTAIVLTWGLVSLTFIDVDKMLLPDQITLPLLWLGLLLNLNGTFVDLNTAVIGAMTGYMSLWIIYHAYKQLTGKEGMGFGDFKLLAVFGAWFGWQAIPVTILLSSLVGAVVGISLIILKRSDMSQKIPFGPYIAAAGWIYMIWGEQITHFYLQNYVY